MEESVYWCDGCGETIVGDSESVHEMEWPYVGDSGLYHDSGETQRENPYGGMDDVPTVCGPMTKGLRMDFEQITVHRGWMNHSEYLIEEFTAAHYEQQKPYGDEPTLFPEAIMFKVRVLPDFGASGEVSLGPKITEDAVKSCETLWVEVAHHAFRTLERAIERCREHAKVLTRA